MCGRSTRWRICADCSIGAWMGFLQTIHNWRFKSARNSDEDLDAFAQQKNYSEEFLPLADAINRRCVLTWTLTCCECSNAHPTIENTGCAEYDDTRRESWPVIPGYISRNRYNG